MILRTSSFEHSLPVLYGYTSVSDLRSAVERAVQSALLAGEYVQGLAYTRGGRTHYIWFSSCRALVQWQRACALGSGIFEVLTGVDGMHDLHVVADVILLLQMESCWLRR